MFFTVKIFTLSSLLICFNAVYSDSPFMIPSGLASIKKVTTKPIAKPTAAAEAESPLEKEILALGAEIKRVADELIKIPSDKEVKQALEKKRASRDKQRTQQKKAPTGGYRPGSYKPGSSYGGGGGRAGGSSYGKSGSPFGGFGGDGGFGGFGGRGFGLPKGRGFGSSFKKDSGQSSPSSSFGSSKYSRDTDFGDLHAPSSPKPIAAPTKSGAGFSGATNANRDTEGLQAKTANLLDSYAEQLAQSLKQIVQASDKTVREQRILNMPLTEINKLYDDIKSTRSSMKPEEVKSLETTNTVWKAAIAKLAPLRGQATPFLIELMIPSSENNIDKIKQAGTTLTQLTQLNTPDKSIPLAPSSMVEKRCKVVADKFAESAKRMEVARKKKLADDSFGKSQADRDKLKQEAHKEIKEAKARLASELEKIEAAFPADKLGSPVPAVLSQQITLLRK